MAKTRHIRVSRGFGILDKVFILILIVSVIYIGYLYFQDSIIALLKMNPYVWAVFSHIAGEISRQTIVGLFYASFFGALFFVFLPIEVIFLYYLSLGFPVPLIIALVIIGNLMGLCLDYLFGFIVGARILKVFIREKVERFHDMTQKWGGAVVLAGNIIPFPIQAVSVVIGSAKYSFKKFVVFTVLGVFVKLFTLVVISRYVSQLI
jgi:membrane protein DedA with SNARE-associated domain